MSFSPPSPTPSERSRTDAAAAAKEAAEQALLPYKWTQTIGDVDITVPVAANLRGRDLVVEIARERLKVAIRGQEAIIDVSVFFLFNSKTLLPLFQLRTGAK